MNEHLLSSPQFFNQVHILTGVQDGGAKVNAESSGMYSIAKSAKKKRARKAAPSPVLQTEPQEA